MVLEAANSSIIEMPEVYFCMEMQSTQVVLAKVQINFERMHNFEMTTQTKLQWCSAKSLNGVKVKAHWVEEVRAESSTSFAVLNAIKYCQVGFILAYRH
jgi:hypothetical protein